MVRLSDGGEVSVYSAGTKAEEYRLEEKTVDNVTTYTCFIEAKEGEEFCIRVQDLPWEEKSSTKITTLVDDIVADSCSFCNEYKAESLKYTFLGFRSLSGKGAALKAFTYARMQVHSDETAGMTQKQLESACTIKVTIERKKIVGEFKKVSATSEDEHEILLPVYHEDSKPAQLGLTAALGRDLEAEDDMYCACKKVDDPSAKNYEIEFRYLSHQWLVRKGLKVEVQDNHDGEGSDDDIQIDTHRTERVAAKKRAREELEKQSRAIRIKQEQAIKGGAESEIKTEVDIGEHVKERKPLIKST